MSAYTFDFNITIIDDIVVEEMESFTFTIAPLQLLSTSTLDGSVTLLDNDGEMYIHAYNKHEVQPVPGRYCDYRPTRAN